MPNTMTILNNQRGTKMPGRRVGLSKREAPAPLLKSLSKQKVSKDVDDSQFSSDDGNEDTTLSTDKPTDVRAPSKSPLKGSQTSRALNTRTLSSLVDSSDSSGEGDKRAARASIKRTSFGTTRQNRSQTNNPPMEQAEDSEDLDNKRRKTDVALRRTRRRETRSTPPTSSGEHLKDELGFTRIKRSTKTYKPKKQTSQEQRIEKGSTEARAMSRPVTPVGAGKKKELAKLQVPAALQSPERPNMDKLQMPLRKPSLKLPSSIEPSQESTGSRRKKKSHKLKTIERSPSPPLAVFKMPVPISDLQLRSPRKGKIQDSSTDDTSDTEKQDEHSGDASMDNRIQNVEAATVCPWCGEPVDEKLLDDFSKGRRLNVRLQSKFCQKHKKQTAEELWQQKSYPDVDWDSLEDRFKKYHELLLGVINGGASHFRSIHEKKISSGKARSMKKEDNMNPGYYGPRGFNVMCDYLVKEFSGLLKKKAVDDRVIAGRGSAAFIQTVLVAELAVCLIMEDMSVAEEEARVILDESKALGEMIHEE